MGLCPSLECSHRSKSWKWYVYQEEELKRSFKAVLRFTKTYHTTKASVWTSGNCLLAFLPYKAQYILTKIRLLIKSEGKQTFYYSAGELLLCILGKWEQGGICSETHSHYVMKLDTYVQFVCEPVGRCLAGCAHQGTQEGRQCACPSCCLCPGKPLGNVSESFGASGFTSLLLERFSTGFCEREVM